MHPMSLSHCSTLSERLCEPNVKRDLRELNDWRQHDWNRVIDELACEGFVVIDDCFAAPLLDALQQESGAISYQEAHLTRGERLSNIRGDHICWLDETLPMGARYLAHIEILARLFNATLYTGIRRCEAHYARYPVGFGYQWHTDNPKGRDERVLSAVFYLNPTWDTSDAGELQLIDRHEGCHDVLPKANRLVIFDSDLRHQVKVTQRERFSIATWLRRDAL